MEESQSRESHLLNRINDLESELKHVKRSEKSVKRELNELKPQISSLQEQLEKVRDTKNHLSQELKQIKSREAHSVQEYAELEEENISLQKQLSNLKSTLVEYEGLKVENKSLTDEVDNLQLQLQMASEAKDQFQKQLGEALEQMKEQRERNSHLQKELQEIKQEQALKSWNIESAEVHYESDDEPEEHPIVRKITEEIKTSTPMPAPAPGLVDDLMKELQFTEMRDLEEQLRNVEKEKAELLKKLIDKDAHVTKLQNDLDAIETVTEARMICKSINGDDLENEENKREFERNNQLKEIEDLRQLIKKHQDREAATQNILREVQKEKSDLLEEMSILENAKIETEGKLKDDKNKLNDEIRNLRTKLHESERLSKNLQEDMHALNSLAGEAQGGLNCTQDELANVSQHLSRLYEHVCVSSGEIPTSPPPTPSNPKRGPIPGSAKPLRTSTSTAITGEAHVTRGTAVQCYKLMTTIKDQVQSIRKAVEKAVAKSREQKSGNSVNHDEVRSNDEDTLRDQILKLQGLLATKREQISTLRTVLKANKATYEVALANLKSRYENDKAVQTEAMAQLKRQLKGLKTECQTFASLRSMFASRCEEYVIQLDEMQRKLNSAEDEKKTLNQLLKQAIHQKIALTQRLEEFELARERLRAFTRKSNKQSNNPPRPITRV